MSKASDKAIQDQPPPFDLSEIFHPDDLKHFGGTRALAEGRVYNWYADYGATLKPKRILEIGVRRGYGAYALIKGAGGTVERYLGIDMELDISGTNEVAEAVVRRLGVATVAVIKADTRTDFPHIDECFDLIHIDGDHSMRGALSDLCHALRLLAPRGTIIMDDVESVPVRAAVERARAALADRATFTEQGDFHRQMLIRAIDGGPLALSRDAVLGTD